MEPVIISRSKHWWRFSSVQLLSRVWFFVTPWTAAHQASLVHHQLPEFTQTHVHWVGDAIQPSHSLLSPSSPALNLSQHHGLFQWSVSQSNGASTSASVLPMSIQGWFPLGLTDLISVILDMLFNFSDPWFSYLYKGKLLTISQYCCKLFETIYASASLGPESLCCFPNASENLKLKGDVLSCQLLLLTL